MLEKLKKLLEGWSLGVLLNKLLGRYIPVIASFVIPTLTKWAPESTADETSVQLAISTILWIVFESARNLITFAIKKGNSNG